VIVGVIIEAGVLVSVDGDDGILTFRLKANFVFPAVDERNSSSDLSNAVSCFSIPLSQKSISGAATDQFTLSLIIAWKPARGFNQTLVECL